MFSDRDDRVPETVLSAPDGSEEFVIRVLLVAQPALFRSALAEALDGEDDLEVVGDFDRAQDAAGVAADVVIMDLDSRSPSPDVAILPDQPPDSSVVALALDPSPSTLRRAIAAQVRGLVSKHHRVDKLIETVRRVAAGERVIEPARAAMSVLLADNPLTGREIEVLRLAAEGLSASDIADDLHLTTGTVRNYLSTIVRKTGARNRLGAIRVADRAGWL